MNMFATTTVSLESIRRPVDEELNAFDKVFRNAMRSQIPLVDLVTRYLVRQKGKRVRPLLVFLSANLCGTINDSTFRGASLIEMLHTATLIHDDVVDDADTRRGVASINAVWKNKIAVLMGDYMLSRGLLLSLQNQDYRFLHITSEAVKRMSEGELLQIQKSRQLNIDEKTYLRIIEDKTASLFSACTEIGAISTTGDEAKYRALREYGTHTGMAFQIRDDLLDYVGRRNILGKPTAIDIKEKKLTLPIIHALRAGSPVSSKRALQIIKKGARHKDIAWLLEFVADTGGIDYAVNQAEFFAGKAKESIASFQESETKKCLSDFVDFVIQRDK